MKIFSLKCGCFHSNSFFEPKELSFDDILMTTKERENERKKEPEIPCLGEHWRLSIIPNYFQTIEGVTRANLRSIWYLSEPSDVPCFSNLLGRDFIAVSYSKPDLESICDLSHVTHFLNFKISSSIPPT